MKNKKFTEQGMERGYAFLWRLYLDHPLFENHNIWRCWTWCLMKSTHKPINQIVGSTLISLLPGQFITGKISAMRELGFTHRVLRTCFSKLKTMQFLTTKSTNKFTVVTITNWDSWQNSDYTSDNQNDKQATSKRQAKDKQKTPNNNINNIKNIKEHKELTIYAEEVLTYFNEKKGSKFKKTEHIIARLKEGYTVEDCKKVIDTKFADEYFLNNPKYLNPDTLFRPSNFEKYLNELVEIIPEKKHEPKKPEPYTTEPM